MAVIIHAYKGALGNEMLEPAEVPAGETLAEICGTDQILASINGRVLPAHMVTHMRLKDGHTPIEVRPIPQDGNILKTVLLVGVTVAAAAATGGIGTPFAAGGLAASLTGSAVGITGPIAYNRE